VSADSLTFGGVSQTQDFHISVGFLAAEVG
jgi:hypothetical protein